MTEEQLIFELERRGGDFAKWPEDLRRNAEALIAASPAAARRHREALMLERLLTADMPETPPKTAEDGDLDSLIAGIVALPQDTARSSSVLGLPGTARLRYAACFVALLAGFAVGAIDGRRTTVPADLLDLALGPTGGLNVE